MKPENIEKIRYWMGNKLPAPVFKIALSFRLLYKNVRYGEKRKKYGPLNEDKTFYIIRLAPPAAGFLANYNYVLGYMKHAFDNGWIPVVDMENYATQYQEEEKINGTRNVWEYFFEQPFDVKTGRRYTLEEVYKSQNVILAKADDQRMLHLSMDSETLKWEYEMSKLVPFKKNILEEIERKIDEDVCNKNNLIGMPIRGGDLQRRVIGHAIQPTAEEMLSIAMKRKEEWKADGLFVTTEDKTIIDSARNQMDVFYIKRSRIDGADIKMTNAVSFGKSNQKYSALLGYLTEVKMLSQADYLIGTLTNGTIVAAIWNCGKYKHVEVVDKGVWK